MRGHPIQRRSFLTLLGGAASAWPLATHAQQQGMPVVGWLGSSARTPRELAAFQRALSEAGLIAGRDILIEYHIAEGQYGRLPVLAADLVRRRVNVLVANTSPSALAARAATTTIPIIFSVNTDPVKLGLVASFSRPGGNVTGVHSFEDELEAKRLGLLREMVPTAALIAVIYNPSNPNFQAVNDVEQAARAVGQQVVVLKASTEGEIDTAFATLVRLRAGALIVGGDPFFSARNEQFITLAARHSVPAIASRRRFVDAGGLMSYGPSTDELYRQLGVYTARVIKGAKPADLPVFSSTRFEFLINLKTAKALGLDVPPMLTPRADEIIE